MSDNAELKLLHRAVRRGWNIPDQVKDALPVAMVQIVADQGASKRDKIAAARVIVQMEGQNISLDPPVQKNVNVNLSEEQVDELISRELAAIEHLEQAAALEATERTSPETATESELPSPDEICPPDVGDHRAGY